MMLIDFQKAFDILDHKILLHEMKCLDFSDKTTNDFTLTEFLLFR